MAIVLLGYDPDIHDDAATVEGRHASITDVKGQAANALLIAFPTEARQA